MPAAPRRTQAQRRETTRQQLLVAALDLLVERGISAFITSDVSRLAGVSQGALFKHFPTKAQLVAATTEHLFARLRDDYERRFLALPAESRTLDVAFDLLWQSMADPRLAAAYELYTAARTDDALRAAIEPVAAAHEARLRTLARALLPDLVAIDADRFDAAVELAILTMQGLILNQLGLPDADARERVLGNLHQVARAAMTLGASS